MKAFIILQSTVTIITNNSLVILMKTFRGVRIFVLVVNDEDSKINTSYLSAY